MRPSHLAISFLVCLVALVVHRLPPCGYISTRLRAQRGFADSIYSLNKCVKISKLFIYSFKCFENLTLCHVLAIIYNSKLITSMLNCCAHAARQRILFPLFRLQIISAPYQAATKCHIIYYVILVTIVKLFCYGCNATLHSESLLLKDQLYCMSYKSHY